MWRIIIINALYNVIVHQVGHLPRISKSILVRTFQVVLEMRMLINSIEIINTKRHLMMTETE